MHSLDAYYMSTMVERSLAHSRFLKISHLGAQVAFEVETRLAPQPRRRPGWQTVLPWFASAR